MIAVIFESWTKQGRGDTYLEMGQSMMSLVEGFDGFISIERFESVVQSGEFVASVTRDYSMQERSQAPVDSINAHG